MKDSFKAFLGRRLDYIKSCAYYIKGDLKNCFCFRKRKVLRKRFLVPMKNKTKVVMTFVFVGLGIIVGRLVYISVKKGMSYEKLVLEQQKYTSTIIPYKRGDILDSNGTVLATTKKKYTLIIEPKNVLLYEKNTEITKNALKMYFGLTDAELNTALENKESYREVVKKDLEYDDVKPYMDYLKTAEGEKVMGVILEEKYERYYPNNELACHVVGFTNDDGFGMYGVEGSYNDYLSGTNGRKYTYLNEEYNLTNDIEDPVDGCNIVTSIDANIQSIIEKKVDEYMETEGAKNVSVLVMDPSNSNILAMYNSHQFDLNDPRNVDAIRYQYDNGEEAVTDAQFEQIKDDLTDEEVSDGLNKLWRNFIISDVFEPGSTYKTFSIAGALEEGAITKDDSFFCDGGEQKDIYFIKCHAYNRGGHGMLDAAGALAQSCNDALMQIAVKEGSVKFDKYQKLFGFGQRTNIDLQGEPSNASLSSIIYHEDTLNPVELATSSFGQGVCVSMIELGTAFCSVINGGCYYEPSVVQKIEDANGNVIEDRKSVMVRRTISEDVAEYMKSALRSVITEGTGGKAAVEGYDIGGKTGTAEKLPRGNGKYLISFIGFAPVDTPQVVVYVVVDEPNVEDQSSSAASSLLFASIAEELFPYMNIYKTNDDFDIDAASTYDEPAESIYEGEVPANDVAGGEENPYVSGEQTETTEAGQDTTETVTEETTEENTEATGETENQ